MTEPAMPSPLSVDLRERVVIAVAGGGSFYRCEDRGYGAARWAAYGWEGASRMPISKSDFAGASTPEALIERIPQAEPDLPVPVSIEALCAVVDVGNAEEVDEFVSRAVADLGGVDFVFNCAGVNPTPIPLEETSDEYFDRLVNANLKGVFNVTRACVPSLARSAYPSIVNVSSILGTRGSPQQSVYCATKWGLIGLTKSLALELGPRGIRVNCVAPGEVETPTNAEIMRGGDAQERMKEKNALGRLGLPQDVVEVVVFLMSEGARYMNGSVVEVDGGMK